MNKYKKLASNTIIFAVGSFSSKILSVLLLRLYTGCMTKAEFSTADLVQNLVNLIGPVASLSISDAILRYGLDRHIKRNKVYSTGVAICIFGIIASMCVFPIIGLFKDFRPYIPYMMILLFTSEFRWLNQQYAKVKNYTRLYAVDGVLSVFTLTVFMVIFLIGFKMNIKGYLAALIFSDILSIVFLMYTANMNRDFSMKLVDRNLIRKMVIYSLPLIPTKVLWWLVGSSDKFMLVGIFHLDNENGLYAAAYRIPNFISMVSTIFFYAWQMSAITEGDSPERRKFYTRVFDAYISLMFVGSAGIMLFAKPLTRLLTDKAFWDSYTYTPFLIIASLIMSFCMFLSSIYNVINQNGNSFKTSVLAVVVNMALNLILISLFKAQGAAVATMVAYFVCFIARIADTKKIVKYSVSWRKLVTNFALIFFMAIVILAKMPLSFLWLLLAFLAMLVVNCGSIEQTIRKILGR